MKNKILKFVVLSLLICFNLKIEAQENKEYSCEELEEFAQAICGTARMLSRGDSISKAGEIIENEFLKKFGIDKNDPNYKQLVAAVYNKYAECLICKDNPRSRSRVPEHFLKRVVSLGMYESILYDFLLYDEEEYPIDVNTIEILPNGEKETFLDYIDKILDDPEVSKKYDVKEIRDLRGLIIEDYRAKKASELK